MVQSLRSWVTLFALCATVSLTACAKPDPKPIIQTRVTQVEIPSQNRTCPKINVSDIPDPDDPNVTQRDVSVFIVEAVGVAEHCRRDLNTTVAVVDDFNQTAAALAQANEETE